MVRDLGGITRSQTLREDGWSSRALSAAVGTGALIRPRNGWLATPDADPQLVAAARAAVVLTCVTQAERLGLWSIVRVARPHVGALPSAGRVRVARDPETGDRLAHVHWSAPVVPRDPASLIDPVENVLLTVASCRPYEEALAIWNSALNKGLVLLPALRRLPLKERARRVADDASPFADSGLETVVPARLRWLRLPLRRQIWIHGHRVDHLIGDRLVLQIDGSSHVGAQRQEDIRHDAALVLLGYHVIRVGYFQVIDDWAYVQDMLMTAIAQGLHVAR